MYELVIDLWGINLRDPPIVHVDSSLPSEDVSEEHHGSLDLALSGCWSRTSRGDHACSRSQMITLRPGTASPRRRTTFSSFPALRLVALLARSFIELSILQLFALDQVSIDVHHEAARYSATKA